jgi:hypothetical protein
MRTLARILTPILFVASVVAGVAAVVLNQQFEALHKSADSAPQPMTAAELLRQGVGEHSHIALTDFRLSDAVIEKQSEGWQRISVPVLPADGTADKLAHQVVLRIDVEDESQLDHWRGQTTLHVLVGSALSSKSVWGQMAKSGAAKAEAKKDQAKTIVLVAPRLTLGGLDIVADEALFDPTITPILWSVAGGGFTLALLCVCWAWSIKGPPSRLARDRQPERDALTDRLPVSVHHFQFWAYFLYSWQFYVAPIALFFGVFGVSIVFDNLTDPTALDKVASTGTFTLLCILGAWSCLAWAFRKRWFSPAEICVYPDGLRWRLGGHWEAALWADVKSVSRGENARMRAGEVEEVWGETTLTLKDGRTLSFTPKRYAEYNFLANYIQTATGEVVVLNKAEEFATTGAADFGPIAVEPAGVIIKGGLLFGDRHQPWSNIDHFEIDNGHLVIHLKEAWFFHTISLRLADIPDYLPLLAMLETGGRRSVSDALKHGMPVS